MKERVVVHVAKTASMEPSFIARRIVPRNDKNERFVRKVSYARLAIQCQNVIQRNVWETVIQCHDVSYAQFLHALV